MDKWVSRDVVDRIDEANDMLWNNFEDAMVELNQAFDDELIDDEEYKRRKSVYDDLTSRFFKLYEDLNRFMYC